MSDADRMRMARALSSNDSNPVVQRGSILPLGTYADGTTGPAWPGIIAEPVESFARLLRDGYDMGNNDTRAVEDAFNVGGLIGLNSLAGPRRLPTARAAAPDEADMLRAQVDDAFAALGNYKPMHLPPAPRPRTQADEINYLRSTLENLQSQKPAADAWRTQGLESFRRMSEPGLPALGYDRRIKTDRRLQSTDDPLVAQWRQLSPMRPTRELRGFVRRSATPEAAEAARASAQAAEQARFRQQIKAADDASGATARREQMRFDDEVNRSAERLLSGVGTAQRGAYERELARTFDMMVRRAEEGAIGALPYGTTVDDMANALLRNNYALRPFNANIMNRDPSGKKRPLADSERALRDAIWNATGARPYSGSGTGFD